MNVHGRLAIEALNIIYNEPAGLKRKTMCHFILRLYLEKLDTSQLAEIKRLIHAINTVSKKKSLDIFHCTHITK